MNLSELDLPPELMQTLVGYVTSAVGALLLFIVALFVSGRLAAGVRKACAKAQLEATLAKFAGRATQWAVMVLAAIMILGQFGVTTTSFAAVIGAAGLAIGLAMQGTLSHFASGVMLLIFRPFKVGDTVDVGGKKGVVDEIDVLFTVIDTFDNRRFVIPNGQVFGASIENVTYHPIRRADIVVGTEYSADLDATREVLMAAAATVPNQVEDKPPVVVLTGLGSSSIDWEVRVWAKKEDFLAVAQATRRAVKMHLDEAGIGIPFPQMDVHFDPPAEK